MENGKEGREGEGRWEDRGEKTKMGERRGRCKRQGKRKMEGDGRGEMKGEGERIEKLEGRYGMGKAGIGDGAGRFPDSHQSIHRDTVSAAVT